MTKGTLRKLNLVSNSVSTTETNTLRGELDKARRHSYVLFLATISLALVAGVLLVALLLLCIGGRYKSKSVLGTYISRGASERASEEQGHAYNDSSTPRVGAKGGYSRVET